MSLSQIETYSGTKNMKSYKKLSAPVLMALALLIGSTTASAQGRIAKIASNANASPAALFPLDELRPGMKGVARSVFAGSEAQEFGVEILGVLPGFTGPRQSTIIARLSGSNVDKTCVLARMAASPGF